MSVLSQKLQEAMKLFQTHNFAKSLEAYDDCITFCQKTDEDRAVIHNILSTKATLQYILGKYDDSLKTLNGVLKKDPYHFLSLLRRSQVYKKKNKLRRALKDLQSIFVFCPDNLQISAFKVEIQHLLLKQQNQQDITSQSQNESDEEKDQLNFINLKLIDRKSIDKTMMKERKSRVTILGDTTFEYRREDDDQKNQQRETFNDKALRTYKQIQLDDDEIDQVPLIRIKAPKRGKSILKNKATSIFIREDNQEGKKSKYLGRQSNLLSLIKNIEGKLILSAQHEHQSNPSIKQVQFRKSISEVQTTFLNVINDNKSTTSSKRKSCLKRPSFEINNKPLRLSRFQSIDSNKIDGHLIASKKRKSIEKNSDAQSQGQVDEIKKDSESDSEGSQHNIFGSKRLVLSTQLKQKLGIREGQGQQMSRSLVNNSKLQAKKSILKKNSSVIMPTPVKKTSCYEKQTLTKSNFSLKSKKSVMFNCTL